MGRLWDSNFIRRGAVLPLDPVSRFCVCGLRRAPSHISGQTVPTLLGTVQHLETCRVDLYLDQQQIDTTTRTGKLLFQITGAFAEFERQ